MITFKEIEMSGFKSFADTTHINFDGGITAIVGPNGCGKSNVSDAIRWVLGEQSSKALRGDSMQDFIFAGTEKRKKLSYCEVSLVFDNTNKWFNVEYDEVVLTRKLYRSGESEYYINRKLCRLKDIRNILYDSGIGKDGYSIIGQGRVEEIIQSKPEDRRAIFEEAAGIAKYKASKKETERRLENVRDNLSRANDILTEVERRLGPLKKQSEDAKKYLELRDNLKQLEIDAYIYQYDHAAQTKEEINSKLVGLRDNLNVLTNSMETEQAKYDKSLNEINQLDKRANELHEQVLTYTVALEKKQGDTRLLNEQTRYLKEQLDRLNGELDGYNLDLNQRQALINSALSLREEEKDKLNKLRKENESLSEKYFELIDKITKSEGEKEENQRAIIDNLEKLTDIKANLSAYIAKRDAMRENISQDSEKLKATNLVKSKLQTEFDQLNNIIATLNATRQTKQENLNKINAKIETVNDNLNEVGDRIFSLKSSIDSDTNRKNILSNLQADFEGYQYAVKRLLQESKNNPTLNSAIKGVVGNIISVDEKFSLAIEIALGGSIQNIVTKDENDAKTLINYLKQTRLGRATFLPITTVKPRSLSAYEKQSLKSAGCFGVANELVRAEAVYKPVVESLLGSTVIVDNLDNATALAKRTGFSYRIVTLEGDVLSPQGSMSGGSKKNTTDSSLLNKEAEIKNLAKQIEDKSIELKALSGQQSSLIDALNKLKVLLTRENDELANVNSEFFTKNSRLENLKENLAKIDEDIFSLNSQITVANNIVKDLDEKINSIDSVELNYNASQQKASEYSKNNTTLYDELKQKRDEYQDSMTTSKVQIAATEEKINSLNKDIETQTSEIENIKRNIEIVTKNLLSQQAVYDEAMSLNKAKSEDKEVEELKEKLNDLNTKISQFDDFKQTLMRELKDLDDKKNQLNNEIGRINNKIYQQESNLQKVDIDIENMQERIFEEYEMTYNDCLPYKSQTENFDIKETLIKINKIKSQMNSLGPVNIHALEEYKTEGGRYEELNGQITDLKQAEEDAVKIIADLSKEMLDKFNTEFVKIQANFTKVFKELFGGGNARLELLPSEDPLTAGVEIIAQPPGKVLQQITLLSGGEKTMTAIAILFAILKLKPMPFCFLDEIEAALDDANIDRYARYLKRFSDETQFIVITHRKPTMELADSLYGVTMEEKGVSKIVSVKLADAVKVAETEEKNNQETA